jgi:hypothetical protein
MNLAYLLIKPSNFIKEQFQTILSKSLDDLNVFIYDNDDMDISWLLSIAIQADCVIIDIDNCDPLTQKFVTFILAQPNAYYITNDETTPYRLISKNRIYDLNWIIEKLEAESQQDDEDDVQEE